MAGDWIKMRSELWTHPKFIALSNMLLFCEEDGLNRGLLTYACGVDALELDVYPRSEKSVTELALRGVTKRALRDVTMCALIRVWCAVNAHCKVVDSDAICSPMDLSDLDEIAGFDGFGNALAMVGWVDRDDTDDALIFHNFTEYNEPAVLRKKQPMTNAERQAKHRAKHKAETAVTKSNESNAREEKRRDINNKRATALSDDLALTDASIAYAQERGVAVADEFDAFRNYHAAKGSTFKDWQAAWRTWCGNAVKFGRSSGTPAADTPKVDGSLESRRAGLQAKADESYRTRQWLAGERRYRMIVTIQDGQIVRTKVYDDDQEAAA